MVVSTAILLIVGGVCATAPLFKRASKDFARLLSIIGFFVGIAVIVVAIDLALGLNFLSSIFGIGFEPNPTSNFPYLKYYLPVMAVLGIMLISRPLKNLRWASLISLGVGILVAAYLRVAFPGLLTNLELGIIFLVITLILYTLLRFVEDILETIGSILAFPPIAVVLGLVSIYFGIVTGIA
jgi:energy-converting hydrogenase Eha subunit C